MHIAVDATQLRNDHRGVGRYVRRLLTAMPTVRSELRYTLGVRRHEDRDPVRAQLAQLPGVSERSEVILTSDFATLTCDVAWYPWNQVRVAPQSGAVVPTVHDLAPMLLLDGRWWKVIKRQRARRKYRQTLDAADHIITGAAAARDEIVATFSCDASRFSIVPHGSDDFAQPVDPQAADALLEQLGVRGAFLLAVGARDARKNLAVLYKALDLLQTQGRALPLVECGPEGRRRSRDVSADADWYRRAGYVSDEQLAALYNRATALVFPSRYEGFGLPVLEAMSAGGVVLCSDASTLPEVAGDAALYFPPDDPATLARQAVRLLDEPGLRERLVAAGRARAAQFSWRDSAVGTLNGFDKGIAAYRRRR